VEAESKIRLDSKIFAMDSSSFASGTPPERRVFKDWGTPVCCAKTFRLGVSLVTYFVAHASLDTMVGFGTGFFSPALAAAILTPSLPCLS
jgi:hypothetical protein